MNLLILLLGSNPLPNFIIAKYLMDNNRSDKEMLPVPDKYLFVYSTETKKFKTTIKQVLSLPEGKIDGLCLVGDNKRNPKMVRKAIRCKIKKINEELSLTGKIQSINLSYMGGTKTMSVWTTIELEKICKNLKCTFICMDIDPVKHQLTVIRGDDQESILLDLREVINLKTINLLELHEMEIENEGTEYLTLPTDAHQKFYQKVIPMFEGKDEKEEIINLEKWYKRAGFNYEKDDQKREEKIANFSGTNNEMSTRDKLGKLEQKGFPSRENFTGGNFSHTRYFEYIRGKWLEDVVLEILKEFKEPMLFPNFHVKKGMEAHYDQRRTEIDIIAIRGYQLFLFSCTTSQEIAFVKQKAFEALYRAEQLGGEHAKTIIVSTMYNHEEGVYHAKTTFSENNNLDQLEKDLSQFDASQNCKLIGFDELSSHASSEDGLKEHIRTILTGEA